MATEGRRARWPWLLALYLALYGVLTVAWLYHPPPAAPHATDYLTEKAQALGFDRNRIVAFTRDQVPLDGGYQGAMRGALGTLWAGTGSEEDRALLLKALLDRSHVSSQLAVGQHVGVLAGGTYLGPSATADAGAKPVADLPAASYHLLTVAVSTDGKAAPADQLQLRVADLAGRDLVVSYRSVGAAVVAVIAGGGKREQTTGNAATAKRQDLVLRTTGPGVSDDERTRELFTRELKSYPSSFNAANRYQVTVSAGWIPKSVAQREVQNGDGVGHQVAYAFLGLSDDQSQKLAAAQRLPVGVSGPRLTIVSSEQANAAAVPVVAIDLRRDDSVGVRGSDADRAAFAALHSLFDASVEGDVLATATGRVAVSAAGVLADLFQRRLDSLGRRQAVMAEALGRLASQAPGSSLKVRPEGHDDTWIRFTASGTGQLHGEVSTALRDSLNAQGLGDAWVLKHPTLAAADAGAAADGVELALIRGAGLSLSYKALYTYTAGVATAWYWDSRTFSYDSQGKLLSELQYSLDPKAGGINAQLRDYYDFEHNRFFSSPGVSQIVVTAADLEHATRMTNWTNGANDTRTGRTFLFFSRDRYRELTSKGTTTYQYIDYNGHDSDPVQLWVVGHKTVTLQINNKPLSLKVLVLAGDFVKNHPSKPADNKGPDRSVLNDVVNKWEILDDPQFPMVIFEGDRLQSELPGQVVDATDGRGVPGAAVSIGSSSAVSWPDGQFFIPTLTDAFGPVEVTVSAPGYADGKLKIDLRQASALPLPVIKLQPAPAPELVVAQSSQDIPAWVSEHGKAVMGATFANGHGVVDLVPSAPVYSQSGAVDAWLELDPTTLTVFPRLGDGLYGATAGGIGGFGGGLQCAYNKAASAIDNVAAQIGGGDGSGVADASLFVKTYAAFAQDLGSLAAGIPSAQAWSTRSAGGSPTTTSSGGVCTVPPHVGGVGLPTIPKPAQPPLPPPPVPPGPDPRKKKPKQTWIGIRLRDSLGAPVPGAAYRVVDAAGTVFTGNLDAHGSARIEPVAEGGASVSFPEIDASEWGPDTAPMTPEVVPSAAPAEPVPA